MPRLATDAGRGMQGQRDRREHQHRHQPGGDQRGGHRRVEQAASAPRSRPRPAGTAARWPAAGPTAASSRRLSSARKASAGTPRTTSRASRNAGTAASAAGCSTSPRRSRVSPLVDEEHRHQQPEADGLQLHRVQRVGALRFRVEHPDQQPGQERARGWPRSPSACAASASPATSSTVSRTRICALVSASADDQRGQPHRMLDAEHGQRDHRQRGEQQHQQQRSGRPSGVSPAASPTESSTTAATSPADAPGQRQPAHRAGQRAGVGQHRDDQPQRGGQQRDADQRPHRPRRARPAPRRRPRRPAATTASDDRDPAAQRSAEPAQVHLRAGQEQQERQPEHGQRLAPWRPG